jgi:hypothetical protein
MVNMALTITRMNLSSGDERDDAQNHQKICFCGWEFAAGW